MFEPRKKTIKFKKGEPTNLESRNPVKMLIYYLYKSWYGRNTEALVAGGLVCLKEHLGMNSFQAFILWKKKPG